MGARPGPSGHDVRPQPGPARDGLPAGEAPSIGQVLQQLVAGTAGTGQAFFDSLVLGLTRVLGVRYAIVGELSMKQEAIQTLAFCADGELQPGARYALRGTPCAKVIESGVCFHPEGVAALFPEDALLREMGADSYLGVPLRSSGGAPLGVLVVLDSRPIETSFDPATVLQIFAGRAAAELQRLADERRLTDSDTRARLQEERYFKIFHSSPDAITVTLPREGGRIVDVNEGFERITGYGREECLGRTTVELGLFVDPSVRETVVDEIAKKGGVRDYEFAIRIKSGEVRHVSISATPVEVEGQWLLISVSKDVTERRRTEEALRHSEERLRLALEAARLGAWEWNPVTDAVGWSERENAICGFPPGTPVHTFEDYAAHVHPEDVGAFTRTVKEALSGPGARSYESVHRLVDPGGAVRWVESRGRVFLDDAGKAVRLAGTIADISERKRTEEELRYSKERWRRLSEAAFEGIAISEKGRMLDTSDQLAHMLGYTPGDLVGMNVLELVAPESHETVARHIASGSSEAYEHVALRRDGSRIRVEVRGRTVSYEGRDLRLTAIRDISERSRFEAQLRQAAREWQDTFDALEIGLLVLDEHDRVRRINATALRLLGAPSYADVLERSLGGLSAAEPWKSLLEIASAVSHIGPIAAREIHDPASHRSFLAGGSAVAREMGRSWTILHFRDITDYVHMRGELSRRDRLAAMGSLVAGVAHEVRTPLFSISATLDAYGDLLDSPADRLEFMGLLRSQVDRLKNLMTDLLDYGRLPELRLVAGGLAEPLQRAARSCAGIAQAKGVEIRVEAEGLAGTVRRDPGRLEQVFQNLLANAVHFTPAGGHVTLLARDVASPQRGVECEVRDEGPGLAPEDLVRVFEPFFTRRRGGTGLGLSIVQRLVEAHGGTVEATNQTTGGAMFRVFLPAADAEDAP
jgi:PAS domain S-box-containing protein